MSDVPLPSSFDSDVDFYEENRWQKFTRRLKEEPLIPIGVALTCWAFFGASQSMRKGDSSRTNQFFRYRLYAQSFTIVAMLGGSYYYAADRLKRKEYTDLVKQTKQQEKREAWIRELEARDLEDKAWREKLGVVRDVKREEAERAAVEEHKRRRDDGKGVIEAVKTKLKDAKDLEAAREEAERAAAEEHKRRSDDGKGVIKAVKAKLKDAKDLEAARETAEQQPDVAAAARQRRLEIVKKQEAVKQKQFAAKEEAGMGRPKVWVEPPGGFFGWKRIRDFYNSRRGGGSGDDKPADT